MESPATHSNTDKSASTARSLMRIPEVAERLKVGRSTVYVLLHQDTPLRTCHIGRAIRVDASSVDEYIEQLANSEIEASQDGRL
ncbi:MAG TPA: helix-turn-helix domain-containing protein [Chloroflexota bacterium]